MSSQKPVFIGGTAHKGQEVGLYAIHRVLHFGSTGTHTHTQGSKEGMAGEGFINIHNTTIGLARPMSRDVALTF